MGTRKQTNKGSSRVKRKLPTACGILKDDTKTKPPQKVQRHHFIPRWVLREFSATESEKGQETISCYYPETGQLAILPIRTAYTSEDLYKDSTGYDVEHKLSILEGDACKTFRLILDAVNFNTIESVATFRTQRHRLNTLRKFLFLMTYRSPSYSITYFLEDQPKNARTNDWIKAYRKRHRLQPSGVWLHVLRYYLDTPHTELLYRGNAVFDKTAQTALKAGRPYYGLDNDVVDPTLDDWKAMPYYSQMQNYYLAIWEAAPDSEFIISSNSFLLREGAVLLNPEGLHKIYIISPRIALVLCHVCLKSKSPSGMVPGLAKYTMFNDVPHRPPAVTYQKKGKIGDGDLLECQIQRLNETQTFHVNAAVLAHVEKTSDAMITFASEEAILKTLNVYNDEELRGTLNQVKYSSLIEQLVKQGVEVDDSGGFGGCVKGSIPGQYWQMNKLLYSVFHMPIEISPLLKSYIENERRIVEKMAKVFARAFPPKGKTYTFSRPRPAILARRVHDDVADDMFRKMSGRLADAGVRESGYVQQYTFGILDWLLKNNRMCFDSLEISDRPMYEPWYCDVKEYIDIIDPAPTTQLNEVYRASRTPRPGSFYRSQFALFDLIQHGPSQVLQEFNHHLDAAITALTTHLPTSNLPSRLRNPPVIRAYKARLVSDMCDQHALRVFAYVRYMLKLCKFDIRDGIAFKEQIVIGILKWMLENWQSGLEQMKIFEQQLDGGVPVTVFIKEVVDIPAVDQSPTASALFVLILIIIACLYFGTHCLLDLFNPR